AHLKGARHIVLKVATGFYENRARGLPSGDGLFLLLDAATGVPALLLEEHGYLTDFRTAAAVALTLKYLAPRGAHEALLVGAGAPRRSSSSPRCWRAPTSWWPIACPRRSATATCTTPSPLASPRASGCTRSSVISRLAGVPGGRPRTRSPWPISPGWACRTPRS